jgi:hypothetical protein
VGNNLTPINPEFGLVYMKLKISYDLFSVLQGGILHVIGKSSSVPLLINLRF